MNICVYKRNALDFLLFIGASNLSKKTLCNWQIENFFIIFTKAISIRTQVNMLGTLVEMIQVPADTYLRQKYYEIPHQTLVTQKKTAIIDENELLWILITCFCM